MDGLELKVQVPKHVSLRMVGYLKDGKISEMCLNPNEMKFRAEIEALQQELNNEKCAKQILEERVVDLEGKVESQHGKANTGWVSEKRVAELEDKVQRSKEKEAKLTAELAEETKKTTVLEQELEKEKCENKRALADKVSQSTAELTEKSIEIANLKEQRDDDKKKIVELAAELAEETKKVTGLQQELENEIRESKQSLAEKISKSTAKLNEQTKEIATLKVQREDDKKKVAELTAKLAEETKKVIDLQRELVKEKHENKQVLANQVSKSIAELDQKTKEITSLKEQLTKEKSFALEKRSGIKRYMLGARNLIITWGNTPSYWKWRPISGSRFAEVAELLNVCWLEINAQLNTRFLSPKTLYAAYFVFNFVGNAKGFPHTASAVHTVVNVVGGSSSGSSGDRSFYWASDGRQKRGDGWMEIEMGHFFNDGEHAGEVHMKLTDISSHWKAGLIVEGIELRPKVN